MHGISETGITALYKSEMSGILPTTKQTPFDEKSAQQIQESSGSQDNWLGQIQQNLQSGLNDTGSKLNQWYNDLKGLFGH